jgi:hypothetical protein
MEPERLSSRTTIAWKYVTAPLWIAMCAAATIFFLIRRDGMVAIYLIMTLSGLGFYYYKFAKVRHIYLQGDRFQIVDRGRHYEVPVSRLQRIEARDWINPRTVVLHFSDDTGFGRGVAFITRWYWWSGFRQHPVVEKLDRLIHKHDRDQSEAGH